MDEYLFLRMNSSEHRIMHAYVPDYSELFADMIEFSLPSLLRSGDCYQPQHGIILIQDLNWMVAGSSYHAG